MLTLPYLSPPPHLPHLLLCGGAQEPHRLRLPQHHRARHSASLRGLLGADAEWGWLLCELFAAAKAQPV